VLITEWNPQAGSRKRHRGRNARCIVNQYIKVTVEFTYGCGNALDILLPGQIGADYENLVLGAIMHVIAHLVATPHSATIEIPAAPSLAILLPTGVPVLDAPVINAYFPCSLLIFYPSLSPGSAWRQLRSLKFFSLEL